MVDEAKFATECKILSRTWFNIGKLIYLISDGSNEGYKLWLRYSEFDKNYEENHCYALWSDFDELMPEDYFEDWASGTERSEASD